MKPSVKDDPNVVHQVCLKKEIFQNKIKINEGIILLLTINIY